MRWVVSPRAGRRVALILLGCFAAGALLALAGRFARERTEQAVAFAADPYRTRAALLVQAMERVGPSSARGAAVLWADGLQQRSAAMQYAALDRALRAQYAAAWEQTAPGWVTGVSSPWVSGFSIDGEDGTDAAEQRFVLRFSTADSTGPGAAYRAALTVRDADGFWRVSQIEADKGLYPYMGLAE